MLITFQHGGKSHPLNVQVEKYSNGRLAVQLFDDSDHCWTVSINMPMVELGTDEFVFKTYSENGGLLEILKTAGVVEETGRSVDVGFAGPQPICRLLRK